MLHEYSKITCPICSENINVAQRLSRAGYICPMCNGERIQFYHNLSSYNTDTLTKNPLYFSSDKVEIVYTSTLEKPELNSMFKKYRVELLEYEMNNRVTHVNIKSTGDYDQFPYTNILLSAIRPMLLRKGDKIWIYTTEPPIDKSVEYGLPHLELEDEEKQSVVVTIQKGWQHTMNLPSGVRLLPAIFKNQINHKDRYNKKVSDGFIKAEDSRTSPKVLWVDSRILDQLGIFTGPIVKDIYFGISTNTNSIRQDVVSNEEGSFYGWMNPISMAARIRNLLVCSEVTTAGLVGYNGTAVSCDRTYKSIPEKTKYYSQGDEADDDDDLDAFYDITRVKEYTQGEYEPYHNGVQRNSTPLVTASYSASIETSIQDDKIEEDESTFLVFEEQE